MKWRDVNYLCHGLEAEVIIEAKNEPHTRGEPVPVRRLHGVIQCADHDARPHLMVGGLEGWKMHFEDAIVLLVPPRAQPGLYRAGRAT
jgi:hypothetical protein